MTTMIVMLNLKEGVEPAAYERWAREVDGPTARSLASVSDWHVYRVSSLVGSDARPPCQYIEVVQVNDVDQLGRDIASEKMQHASAELAQFAEPPMFILTEQFA